MNKLNEINCYNLVMQYLATNWADVDSVEQLYGVKENAADDEVAVMEAVIEVISEEYPDGVGYSKLEDIIHDIALHYTMHNDLILC